ncbi:MAG: EamA family transporter [Verrucomicrobia bacterium]|nr:EamA family transporter [Verrucomicrobiota bacterium]
MWLLLLVSFIWAFSFGLIKGRLAGVDATAVATLRLALALLVFVPVLDWRLPLRAIGRLAGIGALQFGLMYLLYQRAFDFLPAYAVVLFTLTMPLYVTLCDALAEKRLHARYALAALLAMLGAAAVLITAAPTGRLFAGFALMQASNLCFAAGQILWRRERAGPGCTTSDTAVFGWLYAGAVGVAAVWSLFTVHWTALRLSGVQWGVLGYLGIISSGGCFFWWNLGARRVNAGTLAVFNNAKVPLGVACSLLFWGERADLPRLLVGGALMALGVWVAERGQRVRV